MHTEQDTRPIWTSSLVVPAVIALIVVLGAPMLAAYVAGGIR